MDPKMTCVITSWREGSDSTTLLEPHFKLATPHRRNRCEGFLKENLICTDGKGFGFCKGSNGSSLTCRNSEGRWAVYGIGAIVANNTCEKGQTVSEFTDVARKADWIREIMAEENVPTVAEIYSEWTEWNECSKFCDGGIRERWRNCIREGYCDAVETEKQICNTFNCSTLFGFRSGKSSSPTKAGIKVKSSYKGQKIVETEIAKILMTNLLQCHTV